MAEIHTKIVDQTIRSFNAQGQKVDIPRILGSPEEALKAVNEFLRLNSLEETQKKFDDLDFTSPDVLLDIKKINVNLSITALENVGLHHVTSMFGVDKIPILLMAVSSAYGDCPKLKEAMMAVGIDPTPNIAPPHVMTVGDAIPDLQLVSLSGKAMALSDLHINKDRPMMILASSAS
ncbi:uncharacterized protein LOC121412514 [Lytechinus variegatus]|uniref:uncharacterized protein LOC121412514 n=1 Tax=Lytechinus variegatus TaxID=7654 RepID=UPI001BB0E181|nr:uncharacterized protein LOC121412514 [Lytechinus variegatus]